MSNSQSKTQERGDSKYARKIKLRKKGVLNPTSPFKMVDKKGGDTEDDPPIT